MKKKVILISFIIVAVAFSGCMEPDDEMEINENEVSIACWNLKVFGPKKGSDVQLVNYYIDKLHEYDIFIIQEIKDNTGTAIQKIIEKSEDYNYKISERAGFTSSKEQYGIFYLKNKVLLEGAQDYALELQDKMERPPMKMSFQVKDWHFDVWTMHTDPDTVPQDLYHFEDAVGYISKDTIIIGDLNADGAYYDEDDIQHFVDNWNWVLPNSADTTVASSSNTYDRIIINDDCMDNFVSYGIMKDVDPDQSDHYLIYGVFNTTVE